MTENRERVCTCREVLAMVVVSGISLEAASMFFVSSLIIARNKLSFMGSLGVACERLDPYLQDLGLRTVTIGRYSLTPREQFALPVSLASGILIVLVRKLAIQVAEDARVVKFSINPRNIFRK